MTLNPKIMFEKKKKMLSNHEMHLRHTFFAFCKKIFNLYIPKRRTIFNQLYKI